jgi:ADP-ribose pyrophosphatase YjhB (NUDIX family)
VVALLVPVDDGLVVVRRNIEPKAGMLTFPGGYVDYGESWQQAAVRELREEACIEIPPDEVRVFDVISTSKGHMVTIFGIVHSRRESELPEFVPNAESSERMIIRDVVELAFPQDNELLRKYFCR